MNKVERLSRLRESIISTCRDHPSYPLSPLSCGFLVPPGAQRALSVDTIHGLRGAREEERKTMLMEYISKVLE